MRRKPICCLFSPMQLIESDWNSSAMSKLCRLDVGVILVMIRNPHLMQNIWCKAMLTHDQIAFTSARIPAAISSIQKTKSHSMQTNCILPIEYIPVSKLHDASNNMSQEPDTVENKLHAPAARLRHWPYSLKSTCGSTWPHLFKRSDTSI